MPRKKKFDLADIRLPIPDRIINILNTYQPPALSPNTMAKIRNWGFIPIWDVGDAQTREKFRNLLLELPIFKKTANEGIVLRDMKRPRAVCAGKDVELLLYGLSGELTNFYITRIFDIVHDLKQFRKITRILLVDLEIFKNELMKMEIAGEKRLNETCSRLNRWAVKWFEKRFPKILSYYKTGDLESSLYPYFRGITSISDAGIYNDLAYILKHFGIEETDTNGISERIKKRIWLRGYIPKLDINRLQKTMAYFG